jgi:hypothetical protein
MMPIQDVILSGKFTGYFLGKNVQAVNSLLPKERSPGMDTTFSYTYSKRTKQANLDSQIAGAKT